MKDTRIVQHSRLVALFAGLIFISHPIQTQAVTYIIQRTTSLAALFYLASLCLYVKSRLLTDKEARVSMFYYAGSLVSAVLAMFTKEMVITLPFMILLYESCFLKDQKSVNWKTVIPFFAALLIIPMTFLLTKSADLILMTRASEGPVGISPIEYLLTQVRVMVTYLRLIFIPLNQNLDYDYPIAHTLAEPAIFASLLFLAVILIAAARLFSKYRLVSFGIFWFFLTLLPESGLIPIRDVIFEHRLYLPMAGFSLFLVSGLFYLFKDKNLKALVIVFIVMILFCSVLTYRRNAAWKNKFTLWADVIKKSPQKVRAYNDRGNTYAFMGRFNEALADYNKVIEIDLNQIAALQQKTAQDVKRGVSGYDGYKLIAARATLAIAFFNRGLLFMDTGNFKQAISDFNKALEINPALAAPYHNRGMSYVGIEDYDNALSDFTKAIEINPTDAGAYNNRGNIYSAKGNFREALLDYSRAIELDPNLAPAYLNRAKVLKELESASR